MSHVTKPQKCPCRHVNFRGQGPFIYPTTIHVCLWLVVPSGERTRHESWHRRHHRLVHRHPMHIHVLFSAGLYLETGRVHLILTGVSGCQQRFSIPCSTMLAHCKSLEMLGLHFDFDIRFLIKSPTLTLYCAFWINSFNHDIFCLWNDITFNGFVPIWSG